MKKITFKNLLLEELMLSDNEKRSLYGGGHYTEDGVLCSCRHDPAPMWHYACECPVGCMMMSETPERCLDW